MVTFPLPADFNHPAFHTPAIAFSGMRTSIPPTSQVSENTSNLLLTFRPGWCREHVPLAATSLRHCLSWDHIVINATHILAVVVSVITLMVVVFSTTSVDFQGSCSGWSVQHREVSWPRFPQCAHTIDPFSPFPCRDPYHQHSYPYLS